MTGFPHSNSRTAGETVYQYLRTRILELHVKPGETININELSEHLVVGRSPIRDALIQLAKDGLVTTTPQIGSIVSKIDVHRAHDERFMRVCIEQKVLEEFLQIYSDREINELRDSLAKQEQALINQNARAFLREDDAFHTVFYLSTKHPYSLNTVLNMSGHYYRIRLLALSDSNVILQTFQQHKELLDSILTKDLLKIRSLIDFHVKQKDGEETFMRKRYPDLFIGFDRLKSSSTNIWEDDFLLSI